MIKFPFQKHESAIKVEVMLLEVISSGKVEVNGYSCRAEEKGMDLKLEM